MLVMMSGAIEVCSGHRRVAESLPRLAGGGLVALGHYLAGEEEEPLLASVRPIARRATFFETPEEPGSPRAES